jgi:hypothetical protein
LLAPAQRRARNSDPVDNRLFGLTERFDRVAEGVYRHTLVDDSIEIEERRYGGGAKAPAPAENGNDVF